MTLHIDTVLSEVDAALENRRFAELKERLCGMEVADLADLLESVPSAKGLLLFRLLPKDTAIEVFEMMEGGHREELLAAFSDGEVAELMENMSDDDRTALFDEMPAKTVKKLLRLLSPEERTLANRLLDYADGTAGRVMTPEYVDLRVRMTVEEAIERIRRLAPSKETIYTCFVVDEIRRLVGVVELEELILVRAGTPVEEVMDDAPVSVATDTDQEEVARILSKYDRQALPVVDRQGLLVGIVTWDDVLDIVEEEATEDFHRMAGISPTEESYLETGILALARKRLTWLLICIVTETMTSSVLKGYSDALERMVALAFFIPLLIDTGGNAGTQAATLMIRGMTLGEIRKKDLFRVLSREVVTGLLLGGVLGLIALIRVSFMGLDGGVALTVALALVTVVSLGNLAGVCLPLIARLFRIDPAVMSGPFITTIVDVIGIMVYFEIAHLILGL